MHYFLYRVKIITFRFYVKDNLEIRKFQFKVEVIHEIFKDSRNNSP